ncbi:MAG: Gfo/Idh/MocA family oxidoreductase [Bacteroidales bacterium]|nr:Gfo/Idh/MocA family oxidoreductase [Bacteroidales bacterium]
MTKKWNWGILGCGSIAEKFSSDLKTLPNANLYACASRSKSKAAKFAEKFTYAKSYGSYSELVADPLVDIIYIATPHSHHMEHTLLCLNNGKAVLCEKAFAINSKQSDKMIQTAKKQGVFLMEAFWTRFQPAFLKVKDILENKVLGETKMIRSDFAFNGPFDPENRLYNLDLGGGSLLDIGIYPVFAALQAFGRPDEIKTVAQFSSTGSEESIAILFKYDNGHIASLQSSFAVHSDTQSEYWCENGFVRIKMQGIGSTKVEIWNSNNKSEELEFNYPETHGYHLEAMHVMDCMNENLTESPLLPLSFSALLMETLDRIRDDSGIKFPADKT